MIDFLVNSIMMPLLKFFYDFSGSYGIAIVMVTIAIKTLLMPLTFQSIRSNLELQKVQPKLKEIQTKYKDKPEILNKKIMEFYKENRVNPLGGCLPLLFQLPFFIGLYSTFVSEEFKKIVGHNSAFLFIEDLTRIGMYDKEGIFLDNIFLVLIFGITTFISQKMMMTNKSDPMQKQMLYMMPPMITFMFFIVPVPSGAMLYIVVSNLITIAQNIFVLEKKKTMNLELAPVTNVSEINSSKKESKIDLVKNNDDTLSPVLVSTEKSKRVNKKQKKNRKK